MLDMTQVLDLSKWVLYPQLDYLKVFAHVLKNEGFWIRSRQFDVMDSDLGYFDRVYVLRIDGSDISEFPIFAEYEIGDEVAYYVQPAAVRFVDELLAKNDPISIYNTNSFGSIDDLVNAIIPLFGDYADQYDIESIAREMSYYNSTCGKYKIFKMYDPNDDLFNEFQYNLLLMRHAIIKVVKA